MDLPGVCKIPSPHGSTLGEPRLFPVSVQATDSDSRYNRCFGLTFIIVFINVIIFDVLRIGQSNTGSRVPNKRVVAKVMAGCTLMAAIFGYGMLRTGEVEKSIQKAGAMPVSLIQGDIDQTSSGIRLSRKRPSAFIPPCRSNQLLSGKV